MVSFTNPVVNAAISSMGHGLGLGFQGSVWKDIDTKASKQPDIWKAKENKL